MCIRDRYQRRVHGKSDYVVGGINGTVGESTDFKVKVSLLPNAFAPHHHIHPGNQGIIKAEKRGTNSYVFKWKAPTIDQILADRVDINDLYMIDVFHVTRDFNPDVSFKRCPEIFYDRDFNVERSFNRSRSSFEPGAEYYLEQDFEVSDETYFFSYYAIIKSRKDDIAGYKGGINVYYSIVQFDVEEFIAPPPGKERPHSPILYIVLIIIILLLGAVIMYYKYKRDKLRLKYLKEFGDLDESGPTMDLTRRPNDGYRSMDIQNQSLLLCVNVISIVSFSCCECSLTR
eukprot:TRINITY_DN5595_c0_g1_i4.p1 TRINITY_DN5595_c0_g1~~TRINITY_DN5595_c0_g1_i4.p1  ORF type:complete len:287 (+),score=112.17 TRINITY_DN5595_c0_g1_i4:128-988(+)